MVMILTTVNIFEAFFNIHSIQIYVDIFKNT
jgi:hypothetical protein